MICNDLSFPTMNTKVLLVIGILVLIIGAGWKFVVNRVSYSPPENAISAYQASGFWSEIDYEKYLSKVPEETEVAMATVRQDKVSFFGLERKEGKLTEKDLQNVVFEIGSISKTFTGTMLAHAVVNNKTTLETDAGDILPIDIKDGYELPLVNLSNHTSGLPRLPNNMGTFALVSDDPYKNYDAKKLYEYLSDKIKLTPAEERTMSYSNLGAGMLGHTMEVLYGKSYEELLQEIIAFPLDMTSTTTQLVNVENRLAMPRRQNGKKGSHWTFQALVGAGGILSNTKDMVRYAKAQFEEEDAVYQLTHKPSISINTEQQVGLGWILIPQEERDTLLFHNGGTGGFRSAMYVNPENSTATIVLSNVSAFNPESNNIDKLGKAIMDVIQ